MDIGRFREVLRAYRKELVGSQGALSELTKKGNAPPINIMTISEIETGAIADPGIVTVARIVEALPGLTLSEFFRRIDALPDRVVPEPPEVSSDSGAQTLPPSLTREQYETAIRVLTTVAIEAHSGKFRQDGRPVASDRRRTAGSDSRDRAHHPGHAKSPRPRRKAAVKQPRQRRR